MAPQFESSGTADSVELAIRETRPNSRSLGTLVTELFANLHLVRLLAARDIQAKYKQSFLGPVWPIAQPIITAFMFVVVFHRIVGVQTDPVPYLLFAFVGSAVWNFVSSAVPTASSSLVNHRWVVSRVHFSRMALPASAVLSSSVGLGISVVVLIPLLVVYGRAPGWGVVTLPLCAVWALAVALGPALSFAAVNVSVRDVGRVVPYLMQLWMYLSPVAYPADLVGQQWRTLYYLNPLAGLLDMFRWALIAAPAPGPEALISAATTLVALVVGAVTFSRLEYEFADHI